MKRKEITSLLIGACILGSIIGYVPTVANATINTKSDISEAIVKDKVAIKNNNGKIVGYTNPYDGIDVREFNKDVCNVTTQFGLKGNVEKKDLQFIKSDLNEQFESMNEDGHVVNVTTGLNLREKATTDSNIIGSLENNTNVKIIGKQGDWYKISVDGKEGFVYSSFVDEGKNIDNNKNKSSNEKVAPRQNLNNYYEDMKDTGNWNHVYNSGFTIGVSGFTVNSNEIKFLTDGSFTSSEEEEILKVFEKITPSAVDEIKDALDSGKNFSGTFDGLHISAAFDKFGQITITNDGDSYEEDLNKDNREEVKSEEKQIDKNDNKVDSKKNVKENTKVDDKKVDNKSEEKQDKKQNTENTKVDDKKDSKDNNKSDDNQNSNVEDKQNTKENSDEKESNQKENKSNSLDDKKTVQADDKLDNNVVKTSVKSDDNQNTQIDSNRLLADNKDLEAQTK